MNVIDYFLDKMHDDYGVTTLYQMTGNNNDLYYADVSIDDSTSIIHLYNEDLDKELTPIYVTCDNIYGDDEEMYEENPVEELTYVDFALSSFEKLDLFLDRNDIVIEKISIVEDKKILDKWAVNWMA